MISHRYVFALREDGAALAGGHGSSGRRRFFRTLRPLSTTVYLNYGDKTTIRIPGGALTKRLAAPPPASNISTRIPRWATTPIAPANNGGECFGCRCENE
ncbi:hypothetical protein EVAR_31548_1 [Eumeta japonica]|uniref:Uncharacterized protein n=1 Tax=Eumeta variegata TaxID=151549 RepID=A0A4C1V7L1_EUMVA|nr:hypothetical protein EVAR_31548_1 [Eumeta japonica]